MPELALDDDQWHALVRHLDRVSVTQLMRCEPTAHARFDGGTRQLLAGVRCGFTICGTRSERG